MEGRIVLQQVPGLGLHGNIFRRGRDLKRDLHAHRNGRANVNVLRVRGKAGNVHCHVVGVDRHIWESEFSCVVCGGGACVLTDRISYYDGCSRNDRSGLVCYRPGN